MSIALPTVALIIILAPGLLFRRFYYTGVFSKEYIKSSFTDFIFSSIVPSILIHSFLLYCFSSNYQIDVNVFSILFSGSSNVPDIEKAFNSIYQYHSPILRYFAWALFLAIGLGNLARVIVRTTKLDRSVQFFRFQNQWHYVFSGEILDFPDWAGQYEDFDFTYVDALVDSNSDGLIIYSGILKNYVLNNQNGIDRIYLSEAKRRLLTNDPKNNQQLQPIYYEMPGEFLILPYERIINLHITYYEVAIDQTLTQEIDQIKIE